MHQFLLKRIWRNLRQRSISSNTNQLYYPFLGVLFLLWFLLSPLLLPSLFFFLFLIYFSPTLHLSLQLPFRSVPFFGLRGGSQMFHMNPFVLTAPLSPNKPSSLRFRLASPFFSNFLSWIGFCVSHFPFLWDFCFTFFSIFVDLTLVISKNWGLSFLNNVRRSGALSKDLSADLLKHNIKITHEMS